MVNLALSISLKRLCVGVALRVLVLVALATSVGRIAPLLTNILSAVGFALRIAFLRIPKNGFAKLED